MKKLLALALVALMAGAALAQPGMGVFFSATEFVDAQTNMNTTAYVPFDMHLVVLDSPAATLGGYECGLSFSEAGVVITAATGPNGWTNFGGSNLNHLCGYGTPVAVTDGAAVLSTLTVLTPSVTPTTIHMGPATPSSVADAGPAIADSTDPDNLIVCVLDNGGADDIVATFNGAGIVATEAHSLTDIKALFN